MVTLRHFRSISAIGMVWRHLLTLLNRFNIVFSAQGRGRGVRGVRRGGGFVFLIENPKRGGWGSPKRGRGGARGPGVSAGNLGGGGKYHSIVSITYLKLFLPN